MSYIIKARIDGVVEILQALDDLTDKLKNKITRLAIAAGNREIIKAARSRVPRETKLLSRSLGSKVKVYPARGAAVGIVGPRTKPSFRMEVVRSKGKWRATRMIANPVKYAHLVEGGTSGCKTWPRHGNHGVQARPFLRPAFESRYGAIIETMANVVTRELNKL